MPFIDVQFYFPPAPAVASRISRRPPLLITIDHKRRTRLMAISSSSLTVFTAHTLPAPPQSVLGEPVPASPRKKKKDRSFISDSIKTFDLIPYNDGTINFFATTGCAIVPIKLHVLKKQSPVPHIPVPLTFSSDLRHTPIYNYSNNTLYPYDVQLPMNTTSINVTSTHINAGLSDGTTFVYDASTLTLIHTLSQINPSLVPIVHSAVVPLPTSATDNLPSDFASTSLVVSARSDRVIECYLLHGAKATMIKNVTTTNETPMRVFPFKASVAIMTERFLNLYDFRKDEYKLCGFVKFVRPASLPKAASLDTVTANAVVQELFVCGWKSGTVQICEFFSAMPRHALAIFVGLRPLINNLLSFTSSRLVDFI